MRSTCDSTHTSKQKCMYLTSWSRTTKIHNNNVYIISQRSLVVTCWFSFVLLSICIYVCVCAWLCACISLCTESMQHNHNFVPSFETSLVYLTRCFSYTLTLDTFYLTHSPRTVLHFPPSQNLVVLLMHIAKITQNKHPTWPGLMLASRIRAALPENLACTTFVYTQRLPPHPPPILLLMCWFSFILFVNFNSCPRASFCGTLCSVYSVVILRQQLKECILYTENNNNLLIPALMLYSDGYC